MKPVFTKITVDMNRPLPGGKFVVLEVVTHDHDGPWALCDRGDSKKVVNQGTAQSAQDQANAQTALSNTNAELGTFKKNLGDFMTFGRKTYGEGGDFAKTQNTIANTTAAAGNRAVEGDLLMHAMRTGANTSGYAPAVAEDRRQAARDMTSQLATADASRLGALSHIEETGLDASKFPAQVQASLYAPAVSGAGSNLGVAGDAARTPSFWDQFSNSLISAGGQVAAGFAGKK
jgi:hypothetical protein